MWLYMSVLDSLENMERSTLELYGCESFFSVVNRYLSIHLNQKKVPLAIGHWAFGYTEQCNDLLE